MSVRHALLALLSEGPKYGLQLRQEFEAQHRRGVAAERRAGLHDPAAARARRPGRVGRQAEDGPQNSFRITDDGGDGARGWLRTPPDMTAPPRDELVIKVLVALPGARRRRATT